MDNQNKDPHLHHIPPPDPPPPPPSDDEGGMLQGLDELPSASAATFLGNDHGEEGEGTVVIDSGIGSFLDQEGGQVVFKGILDNHGTLLMDSAQFAAIFGAVQGEMQGGDVVASTSASMHVTPLSENQRLNKVQESMMDSKTMGSEPVVIHTLSTVNTPSVSSLRTVSSKCNVDEATKSSGSFNGTGTGITALNSRSSTEIENLQPDSGMEMEMIEVEPPVGKGNFKCEDCGKPFMKWPHFKRHKLEHLDSKCFKCSVCPMAFNFEHNLNLHEMIHRAELSGCLACQVCPAKFSRLASLKSHIRVHEKEENLVCPECGDEFATKARLDTHIEEHKATTKSLVHHKCRLCGKTFNHAALLKDHAKEHSAVRHQLKLLSSRRKRSAMNQNTSNTENESSGSKAAKAARNKESKKKLVCAVCSKRFEKPSQLTRHLRIHTGEKPYTCNICARSFNQKNTLESHVLSMHERLKPHVCHICKSQFSQRGNLRAHILKVHIEPGNGEPCFKCHDCPCVFRKLASLNTHIAKVHSKRGPEEIINQAQETSGSVENQNPLFFKTSDDTVAIVVPSDLSSVISDQTSSSDLAGTSQSKSFQPPLNRPIESITEVNLMHETEGKQSSYAIKVKRIGHEKYHLCPYECGKSFKKPSDLIRHIRVHTQERPFQCHICNRSFSVKSTLNTHLKIHSEHKEWECGECHKRFTVLTSLRAHERLHTGAKPFPCFLCNKCFRTSSQRRIHLKAHARNAQGLTGRRKLLRIGETDPKIELPSPLRITSDGLVPVPNRSVQALVNQDSTNELKNRPYRCTSCPSAFKKSSHLKQHLRSHTGERPFTCIQCFRSFISSGVLKNHIKTHEGVRAFKCRICQLCFTTNGSLTRHMATHTEERTFICPYCHKAFKTSVACRKHIKTHRSEIIALHTKGNNNANGNSNVDHGRTNPSGGASSHVSQLANVTSAIPSAGEPISVDTNDVDETTLLLNGGRCLEEVHDLPNMLSDVTRMGHVENGSHSQSLHYSVSCGENVESVNHALADVNGFDSSIFTLPESDSLDLAPSLSSILPPSSNTTGVQSTQPSVATGNKSSHYGESGHPEDNCEEQTERPPESVVKSENLPEVECIQTVVSSDDCTPAEAEKIRENSRPISEQIFNEIQSTLTSQIDMHELIAKNLSDIEKGKVNLCTHCGRGFKKRSDLVRHTRIHTGEKPYRCNVCEKSFRVKSTREAHMRVHEGGKTVACHVCNNLFSTRSSLRVHLRLHTGSRPYRCPHCERCFRTSGHRKAHVLSHFKPPKEMKQDLGQTRLGTVTYDVGNSQKVLPPVETIREKVGNVSSAGQELQVPQSVCTTTNAPTVSVGDPVQVIGSLQVVHDGSQLSNIQLGGIDLSALHITDELLQSLGNVIFITPPNQGNQIIGDLSNVSIFGANMAVRNEATDLYHQTDANKSSDLHSNAREIPVTLAATSGPVPIPPQQPLTNILPTVMTLSDLETLIPTDTNLIGYAATTIPFTQTVNVVTSNSPMLSSTVPSGSSALISESNTKQPASLQDTASVAAPPNNKECPTCHKVFSKPSLLTRHMSVHTGIKPYKCDVCNCTFNQKNSLEVHKYTHTSERPFSCTLCAFKTVVKQALKKHVSRAHPNANVEDMLPNNNNNGTEKDIESKNQEGITNNTD